MRVLSVRLVVGVLFFVLFSAFSFTSAYCLEASGSKNVCVVALSGGDYDNPAGAMSRYKQWCVAPTETNKCVLKIMPGVYTIGTSPIQMQPFVDIEGAGENTTIIQGSLSSASEGLVRGASNAEIKSLTIKNAGQGASAIAISNNSASPKITNVVALATGGTNNNYGVYNCNLSSPALTNVTASASGGFNNRGIYNLFSSPGMTNVSATASGGDYNYGIFNLSCSSAEMSRVTATASGSGLNYGVFNISSSPSMKEITAEGSGGEYNYGVLNLASGTVRINNSQLKGTSSALINNSGVTALIENTKLHGGAIRNTGTITCSEIYSEAGVQSACR